MRANHRMMTGTRMMADIASLLLILPLLSAAALAAGLSGTVTNGTTGKPAAGATVTLVDPMAGMAELATTKSDAQGHFSFNAPAAPGPRLARAERGGVNYFKMVPPGSASVDLNVYDSAPSVEGIEGSADVLRLQADSGQLQATELFAIRNQSNPPRTLASASTFEFSLPEGAQIDAAQAQAPNGQPITVPTTAAKEKNRYAFSFALKPGETRLQIAYHLTYSGMLSVTPHLTRNFDHYVLVLPASMKFAPSDARQFQAMNNQPGSNVQVSLKAQAGQNLAYSISGTGGFPDDTAEDASNASPGAGSGGGASGGTGMGGAGATDNRPGGGLGRPIDAPDGLAKYRWYILGLLLTFLIGGGIWTHERTRMEVAAAAPPFMQSPLAAESVSGNVSPAVAGPVGGASFATPLAALSAPQPPAASSVNQSNLLLAALKEELFILEVERQQGKITAQEYEQARAALEQTLHRALARLG